MKKTDEELIREAEETIKEFDFEAESVEEISENEGEGGMDEKLLEELNECSERAVKEIDRIANDPEAKEEQERRIQKAKHEANCSSGMHRGQGHPFFRGKNKRY